MIEMGECHAKGRYTDQPCWGETPLIDESFWSERSEQAWEDWGNHKTTDDTWLLTEFQGDDPLFACQGHRKFGTYIPKETNNDDDR